MDKDGEGDSDGRDDGQYDGDSEDDSSYSKEMEGSSKETEMAKERPGNSRKTVRGGGHDRHDAQELQAALQRERLRRKQAEAAAAALEVAVAAQREQLQRLHDEAERHRRGHMQVLGDLHRFRASQGVSQMSDDFLMQKALELRQDIRDFALQHFLGELEGGTLKIPQNPDSAADSELDAFMTGLGPVDQDPRLNFLLSPTRASSAVEAFLWAVLARTVFGGWYWAGSGRALLHGVCSWLRTRDSFVVTGAAASTSTSPPEAERRFYAWRAAMARLAAEKVGVAVCEPQRRQLMDHIHAVLDPFLRLRDGGHDDDLGSIVDKAVALDRDTSQLVARLQWVFCRLPGVHTASPVRFDPALMELQKWESRPDGDQVLLVVAPGLCKRGRSNGDDYAVESMLLKMEVSCEPVTDVPGGGRKGGP